MKLMHVVFWIYACVVCSFIDSAVSTTCVEDDCSAASCSACAWSQLTSWQPCEPPPSSDTGPGNPAIVEAVWRYEASTDGDDQSELAPYLYITLEPPKDTSVEDLIGFQISVEDREIHHKRYCMTKYLTDCQLTAANVSQQLHFCIGPLPENEVFIMAKSLPTPPIDRFHQFPTVPPQGPLSPSPRTASLQDATDFIPYSVSASSGSSDTAPTVNVSFYVQRHGSYKLFLIEDAFGPARRLVSSYDVRHARQEEVQNHTFTLNQTFCSGRLTVELQLVSEQCDCPLSCRPCPRTASEEVVIESNHTACQQPHSSPQSNPGPSDDGISTALTVGFALLGVIVVGALLVVGFIMKSKSADNRMPKEDEPSDDDSDGIKARPKPVDSVSGYYDVRSLNKTKASAILNPDGMQEAETGHHRESLNPAFEGSSVTSTDFKIADDSKTEETQASKPLDTLSAYDSSVTSSVPPGYQPNIATGRRPSGELSSTCVSLTSDDIKIDDDAADHMGELYSVSAPDDSFVPSHCVQMIPAGRVHDDKL